MSLLAIEIKILSMLANIFKVFFQKWPDYYDNHLLEIKERVISPMQLTIKQYMVPTLNRSQTNLYINPETIYSDHKLVSKTKVVGFQSKIKIREIYHFTHQYNQGDINNLLYNDAKDFHRITEIDEFEKCFSQFKKYNSACLDYVSGVKEELLRMFDLPEVQAGNNSKREWLNPNELAMLIYEQQIDTLNNHWIEKRVEANGQIQVYSPSKNQTFAQLEGSHAAMAGVIIKACDDLCSQTDKVTDIKTNGDKLLSELVTLSNKIEIFERSNKLFGKCVLITKWEYGKALLVVGLFLIIGIVLGVLIGKFVLCKCESILPPRLFS